MIIAISGKLYSGKNTVATIMQWLISNKMHGHNTTLEEWKEFWPTQIRQDVISGWELKAFAHKVKLVCSILTGIPIEKFSDQEFKKTYLPEMWNRYRAYNSRYALVSPFFATSQEAIIWSNNAQTPKYRDGIRDNRLWPHDSIIEIQNIPITVRKFMQLVGTDAMRDVIHPKVWINALFADYKHGYEYNTGGNGEPVWPNWILTDPRFPNELDEVKKHDGFILRLERDIDRSGPEHQHESETALDNYPFGYKIENNGTIEELIEKVKNFLSAHCKLI